MLFFKKTEKLENFTLGGDVHFLLYAKQDTAFLYSISEKLKAQQSITEWEPGRDGGGRQKTPQTQNMCMLCFTCIGRL